MNKMESMLDSVHQTLDILNKTEDTAEIALLFHNLAVREFNYLVSLINWTRGDLS